MKKAEILKVINGEIAKRINEGWSINFGDSSYGYDFRVDMVKDGEQPIRVRAKREHTYAGRDSFWGSVLKVRVVKIDSRGREIEDAEPLYSKDYYQISRCDSMERAWYSEDIGTALAAQKISQGRPFDVAKKATDLAPTEKLLDLMRQRRSFRKDEDFGDATLGKLRVTRTDNYYTIQLLNRIGNVKAAKSFKLGV